MEGLDFAVADVLDLPVVAVEPHCADQAASKRSLEEHAACTRTGTGGIAQIETNGLIAAEFEHWDSRAGDPNLHTHVAVSAKVQGTDGKWRSLDARALYRMTVAASECYNTAFEAALTARLGVTFTARPDTMRSRDPVREITTVPFGMIEFSPAAARQSRAATRNWSATIAARARTAPVPRRQAGRVAGGTDRHVRLQRCRPADGRGLRHSAASRRATASVRGGSA